MDILDTGGDWVQLFGFAIATFFLTGMITQTIAHITHAIFAWGVLAFSLWISVYDYDIVLGYLLGSFISLIVIAMGININKKYGEYDQLRQGRFVGVSQSIILIVMITKIVLFW